MTASRTIRLTILGALSAVVLAGGLFVNTIAGRGDAAEAQAPAPDVHPMTYHGGYGLYPTAR